MGRTRPWFPVLLVVLGCTSPAPPVTGWTVSGPEQLVEWRAFDPEGVRDRLPEGLRFQTIGELAGQGVPWAVDHLEAHPDLGEWGVSFLEVVRADTFTIDGRSPSWGDAGGAGLWFARVALDDGAEAPVGATPFLALEFWVADAEFARWMTSRGYYADSGDVTLRHPDSSRWVAAISAPGLTVRGVCEAAPAPPGPAGGTGRQIIHPPAASAGRSAVDVTFTGHVERGCGGEAHWQIEGDHPLAGTVPIDGLVVQVGYELRGEVGH